MFSEESHDEADHDPDGDPGDDGPGHTLRSLHPQLLRVQSPPGPEGGGQGREAGQGGLQRRHQRHHVRECGGDGVSKDSYLVMMFSREMGKNTERNESSRNQRTKFYLINLPVILCQE